MEIQYYLRVDTNPDKNMKIRQNNQSDRTTVKYDKVYKIEKI